MPQHSVVDCAKELAEAVRHGRFDDVEEREIFYGHYRIPRFDAGVADGPRAR